MFQLVGIPQSLRNEMIGHELLAVFTKGNAAGVLLQWCIIGYNEV